MTTNNIKSGHLSKFMFIEKRKDGKYYLVHSFRENNKIHKIRKFLGKNITKKELERREKIAKKIILE